MPGAVAVAGAVVALAVFAGWIGHVEPLTRVIPGGARMAPATALGFLLSAASAGLFIARKASWLAVSCAVVVLALGVTRLIGYASGSNAVDFLGLWDAARVTAQMSAATSLAFALLGAALFLARRPRGALGFQTLLLMVLLLGWLGLTRYLYGGQPLVPTASMAIHTALLFMTFGIGLLPLRPDAPLVALLLNPGPGGSSARRLLPVAVVLPLALAWIPAFAEHADLLGPEAGLSLYALSCVVVFGAIVWTNSVLLERTDLRREGEQRAREETQRRTRLIIENALDAIISIDSQGRVIDWNPQAQLAFGWSETQAKGRPLAELIIPERHRAAHAAGLERYLSTGHAVVLNRRIELEALHRDGHEFPVELSIIPITEAQGPRFSAFLRDISAAKRTEAELRAGELRLQTLVGALPNLVWSLQPDGSCDYVSPQWVQYAGGELRDYLGLGWVEIIHPDDRERLIAEWQRSSPIGRPYDVEARLRARDGSYRWFKTHGLPLADAEGRIVRWYGSNTDIDATKRAEQKLRTQLEKLALLDATTRAINARQDAASILNVVAQSLEDGLGIDFVCCCLLDTPDGELRVSTLGPNSTALGAKLGLVAGAALAVDQNGMSRCLRGQLVYEADLGKVPFAFTQRLSAAGLDSLVLAPLGIDGKVFGMLVAARGRTQGFSSGDCEFLRQLSEHLALALNQAKLYEALQRAYEELRRTQQNRMQEERLRVLGQMASGIAHDINNALSPAALYLQSVHDQEPALHERSRQQLAVVQRAIDDVANTVSRMREFYRREESARNHVPLELNRVIQHAIELTEARWLNMAQQRGAYIEVRRDFATDIPVMLGVDGEVRDALTNLIFNAVDAMPKGGTLTLRSRVLEAERVSLEVVDTGVGMDEATRQRCLEPFFTTKGQRGTGLGLAMVYGMVVRHSGTIEVDSSPGAGTCVRLSFPRARDAQIPAVRAADAPPARHRQRILVIDDDPVILTALKTVLEGDGHVVVTAEGGEQGVNKFAAAKSTGDGFDFVITDLGMPHVDGRQVAAAIKQASSVPVVLLTGWGHSMQGEIIPNIDRILRKPPRVNELRQVLAEFADSK